jgi:hypothetical protein
MEEKKDDEAEPMEEEDKEEQKKEGQPQVPSLLSRFPSAAL